MLRLVSFFFALIGASQLVYGQIGGDRTGNGVSVEPLNLMKVYSDACYPEWERQTACDDLQKVVDADGEEFLIKISHSAESYFYKCCWV